MSPCSARYHPRFENKSMTPSSSKPTPRPGQPVRGSRTGRPVMALLDLLGRRWALRVLWELRDDDPLTFRELQSRSGDISSSVLNDRLRELREASIVDAQPGVATGSRPKVRTSWRR